MVIYILEVVQLVIYALIVLDGTLSFETQYVAMRFDVLPNVLLDPFIVSTPVGDSNVAKRVHRKDPISLSYRIDLFDLVEHDMLDFDVIQGMH